MPKRPFQSLAWPLSAHQIEALNTMLETLFREFRRGNNTDALTGVLSVDKGGSGRASAIPYALIAGGISTTGQHQSLPDLGTAGQLLTSQGAGALPSWEDAPTPIATLDDLTDVTITAPQDGDLLQYDSGSGEWVNAAVPTTPYYEWSVLTNGDPVSPELIFAGGDVIMIRVP